MLWGWESVSLTLGNEKIPKGPGSGAVASSWNSFSANQALACPSVQHLNTSQRSEQKQLLNSQSETSDVIYPRHTQIGNRSRAPARGLGLELEETSSLLLPSPVPRHLRLNCLQLSSPSDEEQCEGRAQV